MIIHAALECPTDTADPLQIFRLSQDSSEAETFLKCAAEARASHGPHGACLYLYQVEEYSTMSLFLNTNGTAGFALRASEIVSVFAHYRLHGRGVSRALLDMATSSGGNRLDAFDTRLPAIYERSGFKPVARLAWDDSSAPADWEYEAMSAFSHGRPDVVFMVHGLAEASESRVLSYAEGVERQLAALKMRV